MDLLHVDFTSIEMTLDLNRPPKKHPGVPWPPIMTAKTVAKFLYQVYILIFGTPARLLSDWGANFMSSIIDEMCKLLGMKKL